MTIEQLVLITLGILVSIMGFFLKRIIEKIDKHDSLMNSHNVSIKVIETEHNTLNNRIDDLFLAIRELGIEIKQLSKELSKKKDIERY